MPCRNSGASRSRVSELNVADVSMLGVDANVQLERAPPMPPSGATVTKAGPWGPAAGPWSR